MTPLGLSCAPLWHAILQYSAMFEW